MDNTYMRRALQLAHGGEGRVAPNPMVGAVVVARGRIIGEGFHRTFGGPHAEVNAIASVNETDRPLLKEATIYVTLEPCSHYGKTPPCARLIIDSGIPRVVTGAPDPNPLVAGRGIRMLREAGIEVTEGVLLKECLDINRRFMTAHTCGRPW
ncbi:MAG: bifunctional diaminohydroxyphosphoribosylaminopyrimidine deaminase/5-amino-6-(5-phosphoribosylamino)uracil reductase RibD, partial [Muribaculaceae bacterium]|nr:bifunctional diaminohydroxyphosphoribosylaminopyrimidine deaminase/5-amino-6-(5-phosphoribosylamino)uracil reductase RibD [Muribaculaceae bacterium]